ncbi:hypothetical protein R1flu_005917 [Riccia fluitans]|uniref:demethylphylloquinone reductase n=1 Tax=Riccia fluitans TaxID=41844 RepID=A0ABD1YUR9_9MARC
MLTGESVIIIAQLRMAAVLASSPLLGTAACFPVNSERQSRGRGNADLNIRRHFRSIPKLPSIKIRLSGISTGIVSVVSALSFDGQPGAAGEVTVGDERYWKSYAWSQNKTPRICIVGGGFGGLYTALRLDSLFWEADKRPQILLIDQYDRFVFKPLLYEILSKEVDQWEIAPTFTELLANTNVTFIKDSVKAVSAPGQSRRENGSFASSGDNTVGTVLLESGTRVNYDWLVLALGSESKLDFVPGAAENALPFVTLENALEVDRRLTDLESERSGLDKPIEVMIVGSGYSGVELAATLSERLGKKGKVRVVDAGSDICSSAPAGNREAAKKVLSSRNVDLVLGYYVTGIRSSEDSSTSSPENNGSASTSGSSRYSISLKLVTSRKRSDDSHLEADLVLWTVGTKATVPSRDLDTDYPAFPVNGRGQADTDEFLRVKGHPRIFAIGDSASTKDSAGRSLPSTAQVAFQQADYAGWNLWAAINDRPLLPFRYQHLGEMMTLGRTDGAVTAGFVDLTLDGFVAHSARKLAYLYRLPTDEHKTKVALSWLAKSTMDTIALVQNEVTKALKPK